MANILTLGHENHVLGDVAGVVTNALECAQYPHHHHATGDVAGIFHHEGQQSPGRSLILFIDLLVFFHDAQGLLGIQPGKGIQGIMQHAEHVGADVADFHVTPGSLAFFGQFDGHLGNFLGFVTHTFQVRHHLDHGNHQAQVPGCRLPAGDDQDGFFIQVHFHLVDQLVAKADFFRQLAVTVNQ